MNMVAIAILSLGLVIFLLSLPLVYRKIPMNPLYGVRIPASFESSERWYDINAYGGRQMATWSWLPIAAGLAGLFVTPDHTPVYAMCAVPLTLLAPFVPLIQVLRWSRRGHASRVTLQTSVAPGFLPCWRHVLIRHQIRPLHRRLRHRHGQRGRGHVGPRL